MRFFLLMKQFIETNMDNTEASGKLMQVNC